MKLWTANHIQDTAELALAPGNALFAAPSRAEVAAKVKERAKPGTLWLIRQVELAPSLDAVIALIERRPNADLGLVVLQSERVRFTDKGQLRLVEDAPAEPAAPRPVPGCVACAERSRRGFDGQCAVHAHERTRAELAAERAKEIP